MGQRSRSYEQQQLARKAVYGARTSGHDGGENMLDTGYGSVCDVGDVDSFFTNDSSTMMIAGAPGFLVSDAFALAPAGVARMPRMFLEDAG